MQDYQRRALHVDEELRPQGQSPTQRITQRAQRSKPCLQRPAKSDIEFQSNLNRHNTEAEQTCTGICTSLACLTLVRNRLAVRLPCREGKLNQENER